MVDSKTSFVYYITAVLGRPRTLRGSLEDIDALDRRILDDIHQTYFGGILAVLRPNFIV
jgi:hypothetical protein